VADRIGLDYRHGQALSALTANGAVQARRVSLNVVRVGDVNVYNVEAIVLPTSMDMVLLGNSYLAHFQMKRENDQMVLDKRF
jgi:aspartyl protease family protein